MYTRAILRAQEGKGFDSYLSLAECKSDMMHLVPLDTKALENLYENDLLIKLNRSNLFNDSTFIDEVTGNIQLKFSRLQFKTLFLS